MLRASRRLGFRERWLAESVKHYEAEHAPLPDADAIRFAVATGGDLEQRIVARAQKIPGSDRLVEEQARLLSRLRSIWLVLLAVAAVIGFGFSVAIAGDPSTPINVFWAIAAFLGPQLLSLSLWFAGLALPSGGAGGLFGWIWRRTALRWLPAGQATHVARALLGLHEQARLLRWWLGAVMHSAWGLAFLGMLLGLLAALSLRSYGFVVETTILPEGAFVRVVTVLGSLPAHMGFPLPDESVVRAGLRGDPWDDTARKVWAYWFVGLLLVYGLLPRLLLWGLCSGRLAHGRRTLRLDTSSSGYARLRTTLLPQSDTPVVIDAAAPAPQAVRRSRALDATSDTVAVSLEFDGDPWPNALPGHVRDAGRVDSRAERQAVLDALRTAPPARLLIACNASLTPDQGSLRLIDELAANAADCGVWLARQESRPGPSREAPWREALASIGIGEQRVFTAYDAAIDWMRSR